MQRDPYNNYNRGRYYASKRNEPPLRSAHWIVLFATVLLMLALTITLVVSLLVSGNNGPTDEPSGNSGSNGIVNNTTKKGNKTGIAIPSTTVSGNYLSGTASDYETVSGITSECTILVNVSDNLAVAGKNADVVIHPASMTKVMTLLVACERLNDPNALLTVTQEMLDRRTELDGSGELVDNTTVVDADGDSLQIEIAGKSITVEDALYLINYQSDTAACIMIAEHIAGSEEDFVVLMNQKAREIGLTKTNFVNATGLTERSGEYNTTTCREMAAIMACALKNPVAKKIISSTEKYYVDIYEDGKKTEYQVPFFADWHNRQARLNGNTKAGSVTIKGGKTGYEDIPTSCFVTYGTSSKDSNTYVCVIVGKTIGSDAAAVYNATGTEDMRKVYKLYID